MNFQWRSPRIYDMKDGFYLSIGFFQVETSGAGGSNDG
jgi:hypothetical protein